MQEDREHCVIGDRYVVPQAFLRRTGLLVSKIGSVLSLTADEALNAAGLDGREYAILAILADDAPGTQNEIADLVATAPRVIVAAVDRLEMAGLVYRSRDERDRRKSRVRLTSDGRSALALAESIADTAVTRLLPGLEPDELVQLRALLERGVRGGGLA